MTIEQYHEAMDRNAVYETVDPLIHTFIAPLMLSCSVQKDHQLLPNAVNYIDAIRATKTAAIGSVNKPSTVEEKIVTISHTPLTETRLSSVFYAEPSSFNRPGIEHNPHMTKRL
jgi:hypothetical protein